MTLAAARPPDVGLLEDYTAQQHVLGGAPSYRRARVAAARRFLAAYPVPAAMVISLWADR